MTVSKMAAMGEVHAEYRIARLQGCHIHGDIRLRTRMCLHVCVFGAKKLFRAIDSQLLGAVHEFTPSVVAFARIALGILVRKHRTYSFQNSFRNEVFRGNQFQASGLPRRAPSSKISAIAGWTSRSGRFIRSSSEMRSVVCFVLLMPYVWVPDPVRKS